ncbi:fasciclin domain-containing protein [Aquimarina gracilis]|uniref:Fasciclin domain-containing protein n=1 Tax=Aquimarina gracilis TaxID=874422 RepID=A0ABU5ZY78_9FLAO|nr:fasciclin domain-containing protein [Aquimarina gracilis]MEB3346842.1 fasciclin domain-containing protein [Aquimarina gracilis]
MKLKTSLHIFAISGLLIFSACNETKKVSTSENEKLIAQANVLPTEEKIPSIAEILSNDIGFTKLNEMVQVTAYAKKFEEKGAYTVFAPTNGALERLSPKMLSALSNPENKEKLTSVLNYHIIPGVINKEDMIKAIKEYGGSVKLKTIGGQRLTASMKSGKIYLIDKTGNAGRLMINDIETSNGIIHTIESVMMPK